MLLDGYLDQFKQALEEGSVRHDSSSDLNTVVRLKEFLMGGADSRKETHHHISLEWIQQRHREFQQGIVDVTPDMAGMHGGVVPAMAGVQGQRAVEQIPAEQEAASTTTEESPKVMAQVPSAGEDV